MYWMQVCLDVGFGIGIMIVYLNHESLREWTIDFFKKYETQAKTSEALKNALPNFAIHDRGITDLKKKFGELEGDVEFWKKQLKGMRAKLEKQEQQRIDPSQITIESLQEFVER